VSVVANGRAIENVAPGRAVRAQIKHAQSPVGP
jgi:hypothetical protein